MPSADKPDMLAILDSYPMQINEALLLGKGIKFSGIGRVLVCGMGGSAIAGDILKAYLSDKIEVGVTKDYDIPLFVNKKTLAFIISYSGSTEETISAYEKCRKKGAKIAIISSGGELERLAGKDKTAFIKVPAGLPPRLATPCLFFPMLNILQQSGLIRGKGSEIRGVPEQLERIRQDYKKDAKNIAKKLAGKIPIIYASQRYFPAAEKWKTDINENAKTHAFFNIFPEFNHNEINGYVNLNGSFHAIMLKDDNEDPMIEKRMKIVKGLIEEKGVPVIEVKIKGNSYLSGLFSAIYLGLYVSYFLALELNTNPTPVEIIEKLKKRLKD